VAVAGALGALGLSQLRPWRSLVAWVEPTEAARLAGVLTRTDSAKVVGQAYLDAVPEEASLPLLVDLISQGIPGGRRTIRGESSDRLRGLLVDRIGVDFEQGHVLSVRGWLLSRTEVRLYSLVALS
jgi:hypothetical protein